MDLKLKKKILNGLTDTQKKAVESIDGNLEIVACAGAGKTKTITLRIIYMIANGIKPENIVAITFTKKAAEEMRSRIYAAGEKILGNTKGFASMYIGTIDSFCLKVLQDLAAEKYAKFSVLDEVQTKIFIEKNRTETGFKESVIDKAKNLNFSYDFGLRKYYPDEKFSKKIDIFAQLMSVLNSSYYDKNYRANWSAETKELLDKYNNILKKEHYFEFSGLLREMIELLDPNSDTNNGHMSEFAEKVFDNVKYLIIDEYQDTNPSQEYLVGLFNSHGARICVVGDADQAIYQFRGSDEGNITEFARKFNATTMQLKSNFRSTPAVISLADESISKKHLNDSSYVHMSAGNIPDRAMAYETGDTVWANFETYDEEIDFIIDRIKALHSLSMPYSEIAVLFRNRRLLDYGREVADYQEELVNKLEKEGIPYIVEGLNHLFLTNEYAASFAIFTYLYKKFSEYQAGIKDENGNNIFGYYGLDYQDEMEAKNLEELTAAWKSINYNINDKNLKKAVKNLSKMKLSNKKYGHECNMQQIFQDFISCLAINDDTTDSEIIMYNLGKFSRVISDFEQLYFKSKPTFKIFRFYKYIDKIADGLYPQGMQDNTYIRTDAVKLMTIHQSKGLEFSAVFLPTLTDKVIPSLMNFSRKPGSIYDFDDALEELGCNSSNPWIPNQNGYASTVDSERNIFYVALTRAKKYLFLTYSNNYSNIKTKPSMFLNELIDSNNEYLSEYNPNISYTTDHLPIFEKVVVPVTLNFSVLSNYFDCPYRFKLANFYGFAQPFGEIQGYGKTMHEIMMHIHRAWIEKKTIDDEWIEKTVTESMNLPYANSVQIKNAIADATKCAKAYVQQNKKDADNIESAELDINIELGEGVSVNGRIDLVIKGQGKNAETMIVDLKCSGKDAEQCLNAEQLKIYAIGYKEMTGNDADYLMIYNLDKPDGSDNKQEPIKHDTLDETRKRIITAAKNIRKSNLPRVVSEKCENCYYKNLCNKKK